MLKHLVKLTASHNYQVAADIFCCCCCLDFQFLIAGGFIQGREIMTIYSCFGGSIRSSAVESVDMHLEGEGQEVTGEWPREGRDMLDTAELLLPIPTGADMDRWRVMVQRIERKHG